MTYGGDTYEQTSSVQRKKLLKCNIPISFIITAGTAVWAYYCWAESDKKTTINISKVNKLADESFYQKKSTYNIVFLILVSSIMATEFINCLMLLIRMPKKDGCKGCLLGTFVFFRVLFTIWYALMGIMIYILMYYTVYIWYNKTV